MQQPVHCPIWGNGFTVELQGAWLKPPNFDAAITCDALIVSARAGGAYRLGENAPFVINELMKLSDGEKARLTTWLVDQRRRGVREPVITWNIVESFGLTDDRESLAANTRAERLLRFLVTKTERVGDEVSVEKHFGEALAWSESTELNEIRYLLDYLLSRGLIDLERSLETGLPFDAVVTVDGYGFIEELTVNPSSAQAFVAMWFSPDLEVAYSNGIGPAIRDAGYKPLRIDKKPDVTRIDDEIFAEIRRSRFLVADMTQGEDRARGDMYFEAGLAQGLGLTVLYSCHKDSFDHLAFDTRQIFHIKWETPLELRSQLTTRIRAIVGEGPLPGISDQG